MKLTPIIFTLILTLISSCTMTHISAVKNLEKTKFDSLCLIPDSEVNNLRVDLIRQTYEEDVNDSIKETKDTPYHPIGFNLGNGLFYDLNGNLCLRLDYILEFSSDNNFELQKITKPEKNKGITNYKFINDSLFVQYLPRKKLHYLYHRINHPDSTSIMNNNKLRFAIIVTDSTLIYSGKKRKWDTVYKIDDHNYYLNKKRRKENYQMKDTDIFLENDYVVSLSNNDSKIEIKKRNNRVLYTIEKNKSKLFIYNKNYAGLVIEKEGNSILIYRNKNLLIKYELKSGADSALTSDALHF